MSDSLLKQSSEKRGFCSKSCSSPPASSSFREKRNGNLLMEVQASLLVSRLQDVIICKSLLGKPGPWTPQETWGKAHATRKRALSGKASPDEGRGVQPTVQTTQHEVARSCLFNFLAQLASANPYLVLSYPAVFCQDKIMKSTPLINISVYFN